MRFMNLQYVKRYRMELDLGHWRRPKIKIPVDYRLVSWHPSLGLAHAEAKYSSFRGEMDSQVFPCLGEREGCERLMSEIEARDGFLPEGTWLAEYRGEAPPHEDPGHEDSGHENSVHEDGYCHENDCTPAKFCGTIQTVRTYQEKASIQNIGVVPYHRGRGIGTALILASLLGLHHLGISRVCLEVTAENEDAVRLYRRLGFRTARTLYKAIELAYSKADR